MKFVQDFRSMTFVIYGSEGLYSKEFLIDLEA